MFWFWLRRLVDEEMGEEEAKTMSLAEVKSAIDKLSDEERFHLQSYLQDKMPGNEAWRREISRRMREMDEGKFFTFEQVEEMVRKLEAEGR